MGQEILLASYYEHLKFAKDLAMYLPIDNYKRIEIEKAINEIQIKLNLK